MCCPRENLTLGATIALQFIGDEHAGHVGQPFEGLCQNSPQWYAVTQNRVVTKLPLLTPWLWKQHCAANPLRSELDCLRQ